MYEKLIKLKRMLSFGGKVTTAKLVRKSFHNNKNVMLWYHKVILDYLTGILEDSIYTIEKMDTDKPVENIKEDCPIWIYWNTGVENAPEIVQCCIKSIQNNAGKHPVNVLSEETLGEYLDVPVPEKLYRWQKQGNIPHAIIADYIRLSLLKQYGGIWMDATLYMTQEFSESVYRYPWYTLNNRDVTDVNTVSLYRWSGFFMCCGENSIIMKCVHQLWTDYVKKENGDGIVDYFVLDYILALVHDHNKAAREQMEAVENNRMLGDNFLMDNLWNAYDEVEWAKAKSKKYIYKLTYKNIDVSLANENSYYKKVVYNL
jgi:hypothetical protein